MLCTLFGELQGTVAGCMMAAVMYAARLELPSSDSILDGLTASSASDSNLDGSATSTRAAIIFVVGCLVDYTCLVLAEKYGLSMVDTPSRFGVMHPLFFVMAASITGLMLCLFAAVSDAKLLTLGS